MRRKKEATLGNGNEFGQKAWLWISFRSRGLVPRWGYNHIETLSYNQCHPLPLVASLSNWFPAIMCGPETIVSEWPYFYFWVMAIFYFLQFQHGASSNPNFNRFRCFAIFHNTCLGFQIRKLWKVIYESIGKREENVGYRLCPYILEPLRKPEILGSYKLWILPKKKEILEMINF